MDDKMKKAAKAAPAPKMELLEQTKNNAMGNQLVVNQSTPAEGEELAMLFSDSVFDDKVMQEMLSKEVYASLKKIRDGAAAWDASVADAVADAMKVWALSKGATHYKHWFSPMTGINAGKNEGFIDGFKADGSPVLHFNGKTLTQGETDGSALPSGGLRSTFEARGYTAWDSTSSPFILDNTLYLPTAFFSYNGEALDDKTPLLRSMQALNKQALRVLRALGDGETSSVRPTVGAEQEYFLIDKALYEQRLDLKICGCTVFGADAVKKQELSDYYYGSIRPRVHQFMRALDEKLWHLGIPAKTEHSEAAPGQYEMASVHSIVNVTADQNQIVMDLMRKTADEFDMACVLYEKPFPHINGSGKHNNWSLVTSSGKNLLSPGPEPLENPLFLLFASAVIAAVDRYASLLRLGTAIAANDKRLGGHEAPPAIISVFLGDILAGKFQSLVEKRDGKGKNKSELLMGVKSLPLHDLDDNDRNRTSPFAFTSNKFEFRMVGSTQAIGFPNSLLNAAVADVLREYADELEKTAGASEDSREAAIKDLVAKSWAAHSRVVFNGNNYAKEWVEEAEKRGLPNLSYAVAAIPAFIDPDNMAMLARMKVYSEAECRSRYGVMLDVYSSSVNIEATTMLHLWKRNILPAALRHLGEVAAASAAAKEAGLTSKTAATLAKQLSAAIDSADSACGKLEKALAKAKAIADKKDKGEAYHDMTLQEMADFRKKVDFLETITDDSLWPLPSYNELLFTL